MSWPKHIQNVIYYSITVVGWIVNPLANLLFSLWYDKSATTVSTVTNDVLLCSATQIANKIRTREWKAEYVMQSFIDRAEAVKDQVNAIVARCYEQALDSARQLDQELDQDPTAQKFSEKNMPLLGVPMSVKEAFMVTGMPNSSGLVSRAEYRSTCNAVVVDKLKDAGALLYCLTNTSELCMWYESANWLYGRSCNPYSTGRIVGGSSGGEGCNIASGGAVIGIGSDIGGSIRMPAFFNGIFGHKPSRGLVSNEGQFPMATGSDADLLATGPMCRYMDDILPMLKVMADGNKQADLDKQVDLSKVCVYNIEDDGGSLLVSSVDPQLKQAQARVAHYLETTVGLQVKTISIQKFKYALDMWGAKMTNTGGKTFCELMGGDNGEVKPFVELLKWCVHCSNHTLPAIALGLTEKMERHLEKHNEFTRKSFDRMEKEVTELLTENSVFLYPSHPKIAPYHNQPLIYPFNFAYTGLFNTLGLPVTQVPLGLCRDGLPLGLQIVAGMNYDRVSIAVAMELAKGGIAKWVNPGTTK